jgi:ligand-binding sensor domain-containing protein
MAYGPNTNLGHNSIILMIEAQARFMVTLIEAVIKARQQGQTLSITPKAARVQNWNKKLQKELVTSSFADPRCTSWYKTADGLITNNWSGTVIEYQKLLSEID